MPDICMCNGGECPLKSDCLRFLATPSPHRQAFMDPPFRGSTCEYHWPKGKGLPDKPEPAITMDECKKLLADHCDL